jgi:hypothetical protein
MSVNVNTTTNTVAVQNAHQTITIVDNNTTNVVNVDQPLVNIIEVATPGPQGPAGTGGNINVGSFATTGSNTFVGNQTMNGYSIIGAINIAYIDASNTFEGTQTINGALHGNVGVVTEDTHSVIDCSRGNFFTLNLANGSTTALQIDNISAGQTVNLQITMGGGNTITLDPRILQPSLSPYTPSQNAGAVDILTFISFDGTITYMSYVQDLA